ncbi:hypothetical protein FRB99_000280 [Tulasnella sp. 403]|nr:hypothetical protein FRB99_000280 [Tulasnella sp. 403]
MASSVAEANREYFNQFASTYDSKELAMLPLAADAAAMITKEYGFDPSSTVLLDFACGTGLMTIQLAPYCKQVVGADISEKMIEIYNSKAQASEQLKDKMKARQITLDELAKEDTRFDVAVCAFAYHHFEDIDGITKQLLALIKPGTGKVFVVDIVHSEGTVNWHADHSHKHAIPHAGGFADDKIKRVFEAAGLENVTFAKAGQYHAMGTDLETFVVKGDRPAE